MEENEIPSSPPIFSHKRWHHRQGYQRCVEFVGITKNDDYFGRGFPLCAVIEFKQSIYRYAPRTYELAKLLASLRLLYGEEYIEELNALAEVEYLKLKREFDRYRQMLKEKLEEEERRKKGERRWLITFGRD